MASPLMVGLGSNWLLHFASKNFLDSSYVLCLQPSAYEEVDWCLECTTEIPDAQELKEWMTVGKVVFFRS